MKLKKANFFVTGVLTLTFSGAGLAFAFPTTTIIPYNTSITSTVNVNADSKIHKSKNFGIPFAEILDMDPEVLTQELKGGKTLSQIATDKGIPSDTLKVKIKAAIDNKIDAALASKKITSEKANELKAKSTQKADIMINKSWTGHKAKTSKGKHFDDFHQQISAFLKIDQTELKNMQKSGMSLKDIAKEKGIEEKELVSKIDSIMKAHLAKAVKERKITDEKAKQIEGKFPEMLKRMVNRTNSQK